MILLYTFYIQKLMMHCYSVFQLETQSLICPRTPILQKDVTKYSAFTADPLCVEGIQLQKLAVYSKYQNSNQKVLKMRVSQYSWKVFVMPLPYYTEELYII